MCFNLTGLPDWARFPAQSGTPGSVPHTLCQTGQSQCCQIRLNIPPNLATLTTTTPEARYSVTTSLAEHSASPWSLVALQV